MRIAIAQLNYVVGDFEKNVSKIKQSIKRAKEDKADLVVFSELAVSGYPPRDFLEFSDFITRCKNAIDEIAAACIGIAAVVGSPSVNPKPEGKNLFNSLYLLADGKIKGMVNKSLLPNYDVFDEYRYFEPNRSFHCLELNGVKIAASICEDLWNVEDDPMYVTCPMDELIKAGPATHYQYCSLTVRLFAGRETQSHPEEKCTRLQPPAHICESYRSANRTDL